MKKQPCHRFQGPLAAWAALGAALVVHLPAQALSQNQMSATAVQNPTTVESVTLPAGLATTASVSIENAGGSASASASIDALKVASVGMASQIFHFDGRAAQRVNFSVVNSATGADFLPEALFGMTLSLDFELSGTVFMPPPDGGGKPRSTGYAYEVQLFVGNSGTSEGGTGSISCGGSSPCLNLGESLSVGSNAVNRSFTVSRGLTAATGELFSSLSNINGGGSFSLLTLSLVAVRSSGGDNWPIALYFPGVRDFDGNLLRVAADTPPVPEPGSLALALAGVALVGGWVRHRRQAVRQGRRSA